MLASLFAVAAPSGEGEKPLLPAVIPYQFQQTTVTEELDSAHSVLERESKVELVFPIENKFLYRRVLSRDGKPLSAEDRLKQRRKESAFRQTLREGKDPKRHEHITDLTAGFTAEELERAFKMDSMGHEAVNGRRCELFHFNGRPGSVLRVGGHYQKFFDVVVDGIAGRLWVDVEDNKPARVEVRLKKPVSLFLGLFAYIKQFELDAEFERLEPGVWWPRKAFGIVDARYLIFKQFIMRGNVVNEKFSRYAEPKTAAAQLR